MQKSTLVFHYNCFFLFTNPIIVAIPSKAIPCYIRQTCFNAVHHICRSLQYPALRIRDF